jgi:hypothetical protein
VDLAQQDQVVELRLAALGPGLNMVDLAPRPRPGTARVCTTRIPGRNRPAESVGDGAREPADVEDLAAAVQHDRHHGRVAGQRPQLTRGHRATEVQHRSAP